MPVNSKISDTILKLKSWEFFSFLDIFLWKGEEVSLSSVRVGLY